MPVGAAVATNPACLSDGYCLRVWVATLASQIGSASTELAGA